MKAYTDLSQSKILAKILPKESADMYYFRQIDNDYIPPDVESIRPIPQFIDGREDFKYDIPCWSLAALLSILPDYTLQTNSDGSVFVVCDSYKPMISDSYRNPVDACYAMILKLKEKDLL